MFLSEETTLLLYFSYVVLNTKSLRDLGKHLLGMQLSLSAIRVGAHVQEDLAIFVRRFASLNYLKFWLPCVLCVMHYPAVTGPTLSDQSEEMHIDLPEYDIRCLATARDPLAVIEAHRLNVCFRLAWLLGLRMCPDCPRCNDCGWGCQDLFGCNMRPTGGVPCSESMEVCCTYL